MPNNLSESHPRPARWKLTALAIVTIAIVAAALMSTRPLPPRRVVMATGPQDSAYQAVGQLYREFFAKHRVKLELRTTNGAVDNIELLNEPGSGVSVGLAPSGLTNRTRSPDLLSLGSLFYEPFWFFSANGPLKSPEEAKNMRMALGQPGSGTYTVGRNVLAVLGLDRNSVNLKEMGIAESGEALLRGELDIVGMLQPWESVTVQRLLKDPRIELVSWKRADAHVALRPFLSKKILPRGVADLPNDLPRHDATLVATKANLIIRADLHPALQYLLLQAASEIHSPPGVFNAVAEFPAAQPFDLPLSDIARNYYVDGQPFLQRYLPFWLAAFTGRLLVLLIPILGIAYPLFRLMPAIYGWSMRRRILRLYGELKFLEGELDTAAPVSAANTLQQLNSLEKRASRMRVPIAFSQMLYTLKQHISLVRARVREEKIEREI